MIASREDLLRVLTRYEGAIQETNDTPEDDAAVKELEEARKALMDLLEQAKVSIEDNDPGDPCYCDSAEECNCQ